MWLTCVHQVLNQQDYKQWSTLHHDAEVSLTNRDELLFQSYLDIEKKLELLGGESVCVRACVCPCMRVRVCVCVCHFVMTVMSLVECDIDVWW